MSATTAERPAGLSFGSTDTSPARVADAAGTRIRIGDRVVRHPVWLHAETLGRRLQFLARVLAATS
jgi:hypothetical protein